MRPQIAAEPVVTLVVAAGSGVRLGADRPKALVPVGGRPLVAWAVERALAVSDHVVVAVAADQLEEFGRVLGAGGPDSRVTLVAGGATRQDSVRAGLAAAGEAGVILVHDAARPLAGAELFRRVVAAVRDGAVAVVPTVPVADSMRRVVGEAAVPVADSTSSVGGQAGAPVADPSRRVVGPATVPVDRSQLRRVQTPQGFAAAPLRAAHAAAAGLDLTDDAAVMERAGHPVAVVEGEAGAFKITQPLDLVLAEALVRQAEPLAAGDGGVADDDAAGRAGAADRVGGAERAGAEFPEIRTGIGFDAHQLVAGRPMRLAGLLFADEPAGPAGHSDGDVAAHAACDALLSAAGLGDLGACFGVAEPEWKDASGLTLLSAAAGRVRQAGFRVAHVAVQVIGPRPKLAARRAEAEGALSQAAGAPVSVAATTTDGLGFTGRGEGLAALATATLVHE